MTERHFEVLVVEDNPGDAGLIRVALAESAQVRFKITVAERLSDARDRLRNGGFDVALLDLSLPDSRGVETYLRFRAEAPSVPVVVMSGLDDEGVAVKCVEEGAQDYLVKGAAAETMVVRALQYAIERHRLQTELRGLAVIDPVTGLLNGRGFYIVAQQMLRLVPRVGKTFGLGYVVLSGLERIRLSGGAPESDLFLMELAEMFRRAFHESAVIARLTEAEFGVLSLEEGAGEVGQRIERLRRELEARVKETGRTGQIQVLAGVVPGAEPQPLELLARAIEAARLPASR